MAITVSGKNYTQISSCDTSSSGGTWGLSPTQDTANKKEGIASLSETLKLSGNNDWTFTPTSSVDLSGIKHLRIWIICTHGGLIELYANGGIQISISDGVNTGYYYVGGRDTYPGGWHNFVVDTSKAVDSGTKPTAMNAITAIGVRIVLTSGGKNTDNTWVDNLCVGDGLVVSGDVDSGLITCNVNAVAGTYTRTAGNFLTDLFKPNQNFISSGFANAGNNTNKIISTVTATVITVTDNTGLVNESGDADERIRGYLDFDDIYNVINEPSTGGFGILTKKAGIYCLVGSIDFGIASGITKFQAKSQVAVFENRPDTVGTGTFINTALLGFTIIDDGSNTTEFILGNKIGVSGVEGCTIRVQNTNQLAKYFIDASDTDVDNFKLYGSTFLDAGTITLPADATEVEVLNCNFESCAQVLASTCTIEYCNFISANSQALKITGITNNVSNCSFISCPYGVEITTANTYDFVGMKFTSNTYDIDNTSGGTVVINKDINSDPVTYTGSTTIQASVDLTVNVVDKNNDPIYQAQVAIYKNSDKTELMNEDTDILGEATQPYTGSTPLDIYVRVRKSSVGTTRYISYSTTGAITSGGYNLKVTLLEDTTI